MLLCADLTLTGVGLFGVSPLVRELHTAVLEDWVNRTSLLDSSAGQVRDRRKHEETGNYVDVGYSCSVVVCMTRVV